jgi:lipoyl(octanoyl) transferase
LKQRAVELFECDRGGDVTFHGPGQIVGYPIFDLRGFASPDGKRKTLGVIEFVRRLEDVLMRTCADFAIPTKRIPGLTGVWTHVQSTNARVGADAFVRPVEQSSTAAEIATNACVAGDREEHNLGHAENGAENEASSAPGGHEAEAKLAAIGVHISRFVTSHGFALNVNTDLSYFNLIIPCGITTKPVTSMQKELSREVELNAVAGSISRNFGIAFQCQVLWLETLDALCGAGAPARVP